MFFRFKIRFVVTFVTLLVLTCALSAPFVLAETPPKGPPAGGTGNKTQTGGEDEAETQAKKEAVEKAKSKADFIAEYARCPPIVTAIDPYVVPDDKVELQKPKEKVTPAKLTEPCKYEDEVPFYSMVKVGKAGMGAGIAVLIPRLTQAAKYDLIDPTKLVLFIDGDVFKGVYPESIGYDRLVYKLERTTDAIDAWNGLLGSPGLNPDKVVSVSVGYPDQEPLGSLTIPVNDKERGNLKLVVYRKRWAVGSLIGLILMLLVFWKYGGKDLLRDSGPPHPEPGKRPYSLAKVQVAWWFFLVIGCFLLIYLITGEFTMTEQALILIGIGTGTALGSAMIENSKRSTADSELETLKPQYSKLKAEIDQLNEDKAALEKAISANPGTTDTEKASLKTDQDSLNAKKIELAGKTEQLNALSAKIEEARSGLTQPTSKTFWDDLVTDANGPSFHRFQMIAWTVILGILFLAGVYKNLAMPQFSGTMLALMGISAGTYLGFKIPEKQNNGGPSEDGGVNPPSGAATGQGQQNAATGQGQQNAATGQGQQNAATGQGQQDAATGQQDAATGQGQQDDVTKEGQQDAAGQGQQGAAGQGQQDAGAGQGEPGAGTGQGQQNTNDASGEDSGT
jgi:hypothetical protein